jgi:hypothetical protein
LRTANWFFKLLLWGSVAHLCACQLVAQEMPSDIHQSTIAPSDARFAIVQSELAAKWTFRLDRVTGHVAQLVHTKEGDSAWEDMKVIDIRPTANSSRAHYQIFTSGLAAKWTLLIDTESGRTWQLTTSKGKQSDGTDSEENLWSPME